MKTSKIVKKLLDAVKYNPAKGKQPKVFFFRIISSLMLLFGYDEKSLAFYKKHVLKMY